MSKGNDLFEENIPDLPISTVFRIEGFENGTIEIEFTSKENSSYTSKKKILNVISNVIDDSYGNIGGSVT